MRVLVIGAGISGLARGVRLKRAGIDDFRILDAEDGLGGTWRVNTYPGAAVYIASTIFQFGFRTHPWRRTHATQDEVLEYLAQVAKEQGLEPHFNDPTWPGLPEFRGPVMHTQQWQHDVDLSGRRVAVVGVGSSSVQVVPAIAPVAESVHIFMREPGWVLPKGGPALRRLRASALDSPLVPPAGAHA
ncbi:flavin-containing monooxygenase [Streptomyces shenzhenensis]|uniref:flavin-containing monooxygenase n=1 Tax=Streptomyces shenzhenensis TaxID=943815 RepID=UPI0033EB44D2